MDIQQIKQKINDLRMQLGESMGTGHMNHDEQLRISREIDKLIVEYEYLQKSEQLKPSK